MQVSQACDGSDVQCLPKALRLVISLWSHWEVVGSFQGKASRRTLCPCMHSTWREWGNYPLPPPLRSPESEGLWSTEHLHHNHFPTGRKRCGLSSWPKTETSNLLSPNTPLKLCFLRHTVIVTESRCEGLTLKKGSLQKTSAAASRRGCPPVAKPACTLCSRCPPWISSFFSPGAEERAAATDARQTTEDMNTHDEHQALQHWVVRHFPVCLSACLPAFYPLFLPQIRGPKKGD